VEVLVAAQTEKGPIALRHAAHAGVGQVVARAEQRGRGAVLESAVAVADGGDQEDIALHRSRFAEEADLPFADALQVGGEARQIAVVAAADGDFVRHAAGLESHASVKVPISTGWSISSS
jgi:hypothetical protein